MRYLLDTDTVSYALRGAHGVADRLLEHKPSDVAISVVTLAELRFGAEKRHARKLHELIDAFVRTVRVVPFHEDAAARFGKLAAELSRIGKPIGILDTMIAAQALVLDVELITNNTRHFRLVPGLRIQNWST
ncbi:MAG: type II toxin-antitoxin system VapC family toxin [Planctomycetes bacterium]|nr:type II toxin-antitoxin system VapC family toxin [Planctomycetota bacterium]